MLNCFPTLQVAELTRRQGCGAVPAAVRKGGQLPSIVALAQPPRFQQLPCELNYEVDVTWDTKTAGLLMPSWPVSSSLSRSIKRSSSTSIPTCKRCRLVMPRPPQLAGNSDAYCIACYGWMSIAKKKRIHGIFAWSVGARSSAHGSARTPRSFCLNGLPHSCLLGWPLFSKEAAVTQSRFAHVASCLNLANLLFIYSAVSCHRILKTTGRLDGLGLRDSDKMLGGLGSPVEILNS